MDHQVDRRIDRLIWVAVNFWRGEGWVSACHHCCVVPDDEDAQSLAKVTHHLVLVLAQVPRQMPPLPNLVMVFKPTLCQPPKESTARGRKVMASALHLASYLRSFSLWAWSFGAKGLKCLYTIWMYCFLGSWAKCCMRDLYPLTVMTTEQLRC